MKKLIKKIKFRMVKRQLIQHVLTIMLTGCAAFGWWGALYPQFTLLSGTYEVVYEQDAGENTAENVMENAEYAEREAETAGQKNSVDFIREPDKSMLYWQILSADRKHIRVKSKILEDWKALRGAGSEKYESGD